MGKKRKVLLQKIQDKDGGKRYWSERRHVRHDSPRRPGDCRVGSCARSRVHGHDGDEHPSRPSLHVGDAHDAGCHHFPAQTSLFVPMDAHAWSREPKGGDKRPRISEEQAALATLSGSRVKSRGCGGCSALQTWRARELLACFFRAIMMCCGVLLLLSLASPRRQN